MNLLLLDPDEIGDDGRVRLADRRAQHIAEVLQAKAGDLLRAGIVDGPIGNARVLTVGAGVVEVEVRCAEPAPASDDVLLLAVSRPKALLRMLETAASLGFGEIVLFRSWRVDKSWLLSSAMDPALQRQRLRLGLEQARRTRMPRIRTFLRFRPFVEDELPRLPLPAARFCGHPTAATATAQLRLARGVPLALAIGPDGGLLPYEVEQLAERGFLPVRLSELPLRTEPALLCLHAQLDLLRRRMDAFPPTR